MTATHGRRLLALICAGLVALRAQALEVRVCIPANPFPPLTFADHEGQGQWLARKAIEAQGGTVSFESVPWPRCLKGVLAGEYDAAMPPTAARADVVALPMRDDATVDEAKAVGDAPMVVVRRIGSKAGWDGKRFTDLSTPVMFNRAIGVIRDKLVLLGVPADEGAQQNDALLQKLVRGRGELLVLNAAAAQAELASGDYAGKLEILPEPFIVITGHLGFNKAFYAANRGFAEAVWSQIARLRLSADFRNLAPHLAK